MQQAKNATEQGTSGIRAATVRAGVTEQFTVTCPFCDGHITLETFTPPRTGWRRLLFWGRRPVFLCPGCQALLDPVLPRGRCITLLRLTPPSPAAHQSSTRPAPASPISTAGSSALEAAGRSPGTTAPAGDAIATLPWEAEPDILLYRRHRRGTAPLTREQGRFREQVVQALKSSELEVPVLPHVAAELTRLFRQTEVNMARVLEVIQTDLMITATLLKLANSALFRAERPTTTVKEAISRLGFAQVEGVVYSVTLSCKVLRTLAYGFDARALHRHALGVAVIARMLAPRVGLDGGQAFMAGVLHDIGKVVILDACRTAQRGEPVAGIERVVHELIDLHHARLGGVLCVRWDLPAFLKEALHHHHDLPPEPGVQPMAALLSLADNLAHVLGLGVPVVRVKVYEHPALRMLELKTEAVDALLDDFEAAREDLEALSALV